MFRRNPPALSLVLLVAAGACSDSMTAPEVDTAPPVLLSHVASGGGAHTYTFDDCAPGASFFGAQEDLTVVGIAASCVDPDADGDVDVELGNDPTMPGAPGTADITLAGPATSVTVEEQNGSFFIGAVGESGLIVNDADLATPGIQASDDLIVKLIIAGTGTFDDLTVVYLGGGASDPADKDACKLGGWEAFGFSNQGQCVRFVETGKDGRL